MGLTAVPDTYITYVPVGIEIDMFSVLGTGVVASCTLTHTQTHNACAGYNMAVNQYTRLQLAHHLFSYRCRMTSTRRAVIADTST